MRQLVVRKGRGTAAGAGAEPYSQLGMLYCACLVAAAEGAGGYSSSAGGWKNEKKEGAKWGEKDAASLYRLHTKMAIPGTKGGGA